MKRVILMAACVLILGLVAAAATAPTLLPTGRSIEAPTGAVATVGTLPEGLALTRDGSRLLVVEGGYNPPALRILDARTLLERGVVSLKGAFGVPLVDPQGDGVWIAGANADALLHVDLSKNTVDRTLPLQSGCWPDAIARAAGLLAASCESSGRVVFVDEGTAKVVSSVIVGRHPSAIVAAEDGRHLYASLWGEHAVDVIDVAGAALVRRIGVGMHPEALALAPDGTHLFVANSDDDSISIVDLRNFDRVPQIAPVPFDATGLVGDSLNALALAPDRTRLYASAGAANAVYVFEVLGGSGLRRIGAIPTGWYPTAVLPSREVIYVANGQGEKSRANPEFNTLAYPADPSGYIARNLFGSIRTLSVPDAASLRAGDARVRQLAGAAPLRAHPVLRPNGPIKHVIYIIKENRTYDQVFGDVTGADGDPKLVLFGADVTPNEHAAVRRFGVFDRTFTDAHVSADGHNWSMAAIANDYVEKMWPPNYAHRRALYDFEDPSSPVRPHAGYLWDAAINARLWVRNYGEFIYKDTDTAGFSAHPGRALLEHTDRRFPGYNFKVSDIERESEWEREFREFEKRGKLPALEIVRLPNDHTEGTRPGSLTPQAFVAQNDVAVGKLIDAVSHSRFWSSTAIFAIEDDCQNGPDHVDNQRTTFVLASPFARGGLQHQMYTTAGVLRTIEIVLGIPPMTTYDARAVPLYEAFDGKPDLRPFDALSAKIDITARNAATAYRARDSARLDFDHADAVDEATFNDILWHAVKGAKATPPPFGSFPS